jgi:hypothetical protein
MLIINLYSITAGKQRISSNATGEIADRLFHFLCFPVSCKGSIVCYINLLSLILSPFYHIPSFPVFYGIIY